MHNFEIENNTSFRLPHKKSLRLFNPRILRKSHACTCNRLPWTSTTKLHFAKLPLSSCAVQVTFVCPIGNLVPDLGMHVMFGSWLELSTAMGSFQTTTAVACPGSVETVLVAGHTSNLGDSLSEITI